jgi:hypothetical protein
MKFTWVFLAVVLVIVFDGLVVPALADNHAEPLLEYVDRQCKAGHASCVAASPNPNQGASLCACVQKSTCPDGVADCVCKITRENWDCVLSRGTCRGECSAKSVAEYLPCLNECDNYYRSCLKDTSTCLDD